MASRIQGITIEIGGDTTKLQSSLKNVDKSLKDTQSVLKDVNKLLKMDPGNVELLTQKQKALKNAIADTKTRLQQLKDAQSGVAKGTPEWDALQREIIETEQKLKTLEKEQRQFGSVAKQVLNAAGKSMQAFGKMVEDAGKKMQTISRAATAALTAIGGLAFKSIQSADDLNTLSKQTGFTTEELQKMQYAADLVDVSVDDITGALKKLKPKITEDNKALAELGVSTTNADGSLRDANDVFYDTIEALSKIDNETERDQKAMDIFGKSADSLAGIIDDGGKALKEYGNEAEELGLIMSGDTVDSLNEMSDTIDKAKATIGGSLAQFGATAAKVLAPALEKVAGIIGTVTEKLRNLTPEQTETIMKVLGVVAAIAPVLIIGGKIIQLVGTVTSVLSGLNPVTLVIMAVVAAGILLWKNWDKIKAKAQEIAAKIKEVWNGIKTAVSNAAENAKNAVTERWEAMKTAVSTISDAVKSAALKAWEGLQSGISKVVDKVRSKIDSFKNKFNELKTTVKNVVDKIKDIFKFEWELPKIPKPHFVITPEGWKITDLLTEGIKPSIDIKWYKKAYDNPVMFTAPTVMATPQGMKGFGDGHGAEIVMGLNKLRELVGAQGVVINVYPTPGMNVDQLADKIQQKYVAAAKMRRLANA